MQVEDSVLLLGMAGYAGAVATPVSTPAHRAGAVAGGAQQRAWSAAAGARGSRQGRPLPPLPLQAAAAVDHVRCCGMTWSPLINLDMKGTSIGGRGCAAAARLFAPRSSLRASATPSLFASRHSAGSQACWITDLTFDTETSLSLQLHSCAYGWPIHARSVASCA
jgi:hypothetical protein